MYTHQVARKEKLPGGVALDESFFGPFSEGNDGARPPQKGPGTRKQPVCGISWKKRCGLYFTILPDCSAKTSQAILQGRVSPNVVSVTDG